MEPDASLPDNVRLKRGVNYPHLLTDDKKRNSAFALKDGKPLGRSDVRSRNGRGKRGSGKPNGFLRNFETTNSLSSTASPKGSSKPKSELGEPLLLETGFKIVIRRLPPTLPEKVLLDAITHWITPNNFEWFRFIPGKISDNPSKARVHSRAYILFTYQENADAFIRQFNGHKFVDKKGIQDQSMTEYAPYPKTPKGTCPDSKQGTIDDDLDYLSFVNSLSTEEPEPVSNQSGQAPIISNPKSTPLIEFLRSQKADQSEIRHSAKSKASMVLLSRNGKPKSIEAIKSLDFEAKMTKDDKKLKKPKPLKLAKEEKPTFDSKDENVDSSSGRQPRRRVYKKAGGKEEGLTPFTPTQILKPPSRGQVSEWPEPGPNRAVLNGLVDENSSRNVLANSAKPKPDSNQSNSAPVRHVFKLTNGRLIPSTAPSNIAETSKSSRPRRRRPPPPTSKPQTAS